ncbi:hypothetical protein OTB20_12035 [Streptomyces sp. H27-H1]|uniref:hypothetical protein n=1 Tax=Streptomyces sp. H27-H1 TaxID=2996461 RepID=UPI002270FF3A|nr:hypothetical protein [Streptomyces sp. H27-H1]MCY0926920.1 hypothetical protein [Streptomyces sp. H27-H1]
MTAATDTALAGSTAPGQPARALTGGLFIDMVGIRARYECLLCRTTEGPVFGEADVIAFNATIRTDHHARCIPQEPRS